MEHWIFDTAQKTARIVSANVSGYKDETCRVGMKDSISEIKGIFVLAGSVENRYDDRIVYLDLGNSASGNDARIVASHQGSQEADAIVKIKELRQKLENNKRWSFQKQTLAMPEAEAIVSAVKVTEWRILSGNTGENLSYDGNNYVFLKFEANTVQNHACYTNIKITVHGSPGTFSSISATDFVYEMKTR
ncbi:hypothetical protein SAMN02745150_01112 [Brevinema andersonii]|uniref:Uncharacterized protein n=1 Tax=Brevinema andersonii TaxID=34097 RepID=A0A1I1EHE3_BREAD|nr:hypothetical protein [Brevinema andersonii]SFB86559.1 hypothetical protein SAMN02745150_01112 [Brevinema andersonii]